MYYHRTRQLRPAFPGIRCQSYHLTIDTIWAAPKVPVSLCHSPLLLK